MWFGNVTASDTITIPWDVVSLQSGSVTPTTAGSIVIYKNNSATQRTSASGVTDTRTFDSVTGTNLLTIDLSDNADAGFYAAGNNYHVMVSGMVVEGLTINQWIASFSIQNRNDYADVREWLGTAVATPTTGGVPEVDITHIAGSAVSTSSAQIGVNVVNAGGTAWGSGAITAASIASNAITAAKVATDAIGAAQLAADAVAEIADGVWDEARSGHTTSGTYGESHQVLKDTMEFHRGHHTATGSIFYVDGTAGNDITGNGSRALPYKTISKALSVCTSNNHDEIRLLPNSGGGPTTITESASISVTKNYVQIRGPGRDVKVTLNTSGSVFDISASGVHLSGMRIVTFSGASSDGVHIKNAADFVSISRCFIENSHRDGVHLNVANNCFVEDCQITNAGRDAIRVSSGSGSGNYNKILRNVIRSATVNGVNLAGSDASNCRIQHNLIRDCPTGITIASGVSNTSVTDNRFAGNTANFSDSGTTTQQEWNRLDTNITDGSVLVGSMNADTLTASALASDAVTEIQTGLATAANLATVAGYLDTEIAAILEDTGTTLPAQIAALNNLSQADIRAAVGLTAANLDTQLTAIDDYLDTEVAAIKAKTDNLPASPAATGDAMTLTSAYDFAKGTVAMTEAYAANGVAPTPVQAFYAIHQMLMQFSIASTTITVKKLDNSTTAFSVTLNDATTPTSAVRT